MEESQKVGDPFLQQVIILAGVLPSQKERKIEDREIRTKAQQLLLWRLFLVEQQDSNS